MYPTSSDLTSHQILAINDQGQITQYKTGNNIGNNVTTTKNFDTATGRLMSQSATTAGQAAGNVLNQAYSYDSLSNLVSRTDSTVGVGSTEAFDYDSLNRLTASTFAGGAVSPPATVQVMYDARSNIKYKSDVGQYWELPALAFKQNSHKQTQHQ